MQHQKQYEMLEDEKQQALDTATFQRVRKWYLLAIATIALTIIFAQILIQQHLDSQLNDSRVINVAGRQRAFSQKLVKEAMLLETATLNTAEKETIIGILEETLQVWRTAHIGLQKGNDSMGLPTEKNRVILALFSDVNPHHKAMVGAAETILMKAKDSTATSYTAELNVLLENERLFLTKMDAIVNAYDFQSKEKLQKLKFKEYLLLGFSLLILFLEVMFIFRPLSFQIRETISKLIQNQLKSDAAATEIKRLFEEREKSLKQVQELNFVIDNAALFASTRKDNTVVFISKKFLTLLEQDSTPLDKPIFAILTQNQGQQQYLKDILARRPKNIRTEEINIETKTGKQLWLDMSIIPMHQSSLEQSVLILCSDITERKKNQLKIAELTKQNYEERMQQKQLQASQIVDGQEEERKRIAKDIHDGIGQMLTALKFNIESINPDQKRKTKEKIAYLKKLTADLIKGVRTATFNLTPPELEDYGIFPALQKMALELNKLTGKNILFQNKAEENVRFDSLVETNIYRATQEAVNNAIKYSEASYILVSINYVKGLLSVVIDDDGRGFDTTVLNGLPKNNSEGGMGVFFMKERIGYINGQLVINSKPGEGTQVTITYKRPKA